MWPGIRLFPYYDLPNYWQYSDVYPDLVDGLKRWWDMYSSELYPIQEGMTGKQSFSQNRMQREHAVPKVVVETERQCGVHSSAYSDMWNLYPSDGAGQSGEAELSFRSHF